MEANPAPVRLTDEIRALLQDDGEQALRDLLAKAAVIEVADALYNFGRPEQLSLLRLMVSETAAEVFCELDPPVMEGMLAEIELDYLKELVDFMEPDDAADLVGMMEQERAEALLALLDPAAREDISFLLTYPGDTAGGIMDPDVVRIRANQTVGEAVAEARRYVDRVQLDDFFSLYVVKQDGSLVGTVPNWRMLLAQPEQYIHEIMDYDFVSVEAYMDQEDISRLVRDRDLVSVPVVDEENHLIGRITHDDIVDVIHEEHEEDLGHLAGTRSEDIRELSLFQTIRLRFPWLFAALVGEFLLAMFMHDRQALLIALPQLAFFFPLIMAVGGTSGVQSASLVIRGLATGEVLVSHLWRRLLREFLVSLNIGALFALVLILGGRGMTGDWWLGVTVGLATMAGVLLAATLGTALPIVLKMAKLDPALTTGPLITTLNDILGILVYLGIAYLILA
jgi:magnesium transporter